LHNRHHFSNHTPAVKKLPSVVAVLGLSLLFSTCINPTGGGETINLSAVKAVSTGSHHTVVIGADGSLWAWGPNGAGQLGDGTRTPRLSPVRIGAFTNWIAVSAGAHYTVAIASDGSLLAWGENFYGQLGDGSDLSLNNRPVQRPVRVNTPYNDWGYVSSGREHTAAIRKDGSLWTWGRNNWGQLGDGTTEDRSRPVQIGENQNWRAVSAGYSHTIAISTDGSLWAWGWNGAGQLGNGTIVDSHIPVQIGCDTSWAIVSVGFLHTAAIKKDGSLWAWGRNDRGQLGDGTGGDRHDIQSSPVQIGQDTGWAMVSAGYSHTAAIKKDGSLWMWGFNDLGTLDNNPSDYFELFHKSPRQVGEDTNWIYVSRGDWHTVVIREDNSLWTWGFNGDGQLGNGKIGRQYSYFVPTQIAP